MAKKSIIHNGIEIPEGGMDADLIDTKVEETVVSTAAGPQEVLETTAVFAIPESLSTKFAGMATTATGQDAGSAGSVNVEALKTAGLTMGNIGATSLADKITIVDGILKLDPKNGKHVKPVVPSEVVTMEQVQASAIKNIMHAPTSIQLTPTIFKAVDGGKK